MIRPLALALIFLSLTGCLREVEPLPRFAPGESLYEHYTTRGARILIDDDQGERWKIRRRRSHLRVYDSSMIPLGRIEVDDDEEILVRGLDRSLLHRSSWVSDDVAELDGAWRLERAESGWDLFDPQGRLLGIFRLQDLQDQQEQKNWILAPGYSREERFLARIEKGRLLVLDQNEEERLSIAIRRDNPENWSDLKALAISIDALDPLQRVALGSWLHQNIASSSSPSSPPFDAEAPSFPEGEEVSEDPPEEDPSLP